jgi:hypothetical protein
MRRNRIVGGLVAAFLAWSLGPAWPAFAGFYALEEVKPLWIKADLNGDGYLTEDELRAEDPRLVKGFRKADCNRDGKLDLREFEVLLISL